MDDNLYPIWHKSHDNWKPLKWNSRSGMPLNLPQNCPSKVSSTDQTRNKHKNTHLLAFFMPDMVCLCVGACRYYASTNQQTWTAITPGIVVLWVINHMHNITHPIQATKKCNKWSVEFAVQVWRGRNEIHKYTDTFDGLPTNRIHHWKNIGR